MRQSTLQFVYNSGILDFGFHHKTTHHIHVTQQPEGWVNVTPMLLTKVVAKTMDSLNGGLWYGNKCFEA